MLRRLPPTDSSTSLPPLVKRKRHNATHRLPGDKGGRRRACESWGGDVGTGSARPRRQYRLRRTHAPTAATGHGSGVLPLHAAAPGLPAPAAPPRWSGDSVHTWAAAATRRARKVAARILDGLHAGGGRGSHECSAHVHRSTPVIGHRRCGPRARRPRAVSWYARSTIFQQHSQKGGVSAQGGEGGCARRDHRAAVGSAASQRLKIGRVSAHSKRHPPPSSTTNGRATVARRRPYPRRRHPMSHSW